MKPVIVLLACVLGVTACNEAKRPAVGTSASTVSTSPAVNQADSDNTAVNVRDRDSTVKTPIDQNENKSDVKITAEIRKRVVDTKMSVNAQNVKIITQDGRVTLRGPVKSADEKKQIQDFAEQVAGPGNVDNQLEIETNP